jgi:hypothetical protein
MATRNPSAASHAARVASGLQWPDSPPAVKDARHAAAADGYGCLGVGTEWVGSLVEASDRGLVAEG